MKRNTQLKTPTSHRLKPVSETPSRLANTSRVLFMDITVATISISCTRNAPLWAIPNFSFCHKFRPAVAAAFAAPGTSKSSATFFDNASRVRSLPVASVAGCAKTPTIGPIQRPFVMPLNADVPIIPQPVVQLMGCVKFTLPSGPR